MTKTIDVVAAVIVRDGRILLTQRKRGKSLAYKWNIPGGQVERGESFNDALRREGLEEVDVLISGIEDPGIEPVVVVGRALEKHLAHDPSAMEPPSFLVHYLIGHLARDSREPRPMEGQGLGWFTADELEHLELSPADEARREELVKLVRGESRCR